MLCIFSSILTSLNVTISSSIHVAAMWLFHSLKICLLVDFLCGIITGCLYILKIKPLSDTPFANIFSHSMLFVLLSSVLRLFVCFLAVPHSMGSGSDQGSTCTSCNGNSRSALLDQLGKSVISFDFQKHGWIGSLLFGFVYFALRLIKENIL